MLTYMKWPVQVTVKSTCVLYCKQQIPTPIRFSMPLLSKCQMSVTVIPLILIHEMATL